MSVLVNKDSKIIVQGFTGSEGTFHASQMIEYGTNVVGGVTLKRRNNSFRPSCFNTVKDAVEQAGADTTIIFVPPALPLMHNGSCRCRNKSDYITEGIL
jgi:succinyl-CoA synthetase alpha subunit